jgi:hypothetical protein
MKIIKMPKYFLLEKDNIQSTINTLNEFIKQNKSNISVDFSELQEIGRGELLVLFAQLEKSILTCNNQISRTGNLPKDKKLKLLLKTPKKILHVRSILKLSPAAASVPLVVPLKNSSQLAVVCSRKS